MDLERVQAVASLSASAGTIPPEFIRPEHEQPGLTTSPGPALDLPVIDLSGADRDLLVRAAADAAADWGIFQVVNHSVPAGVIEDVQRAGRGFFDLPREEKEKHAMAPESGGRLEGYGTKLQKEVEGKKAWVDFVFHTVHPPAKVDHDTWPNNPPTYREANEEYGRRVREVVDGLLGLLSEGVGLEGGELKEAVGGGEMELLLKINYYPPCPRPELALGVVAHTDLSALTVLLPNEVPGLQVFKGGRWFDANYVPGSLVVHIGDQIEILTNGKYKSVLHRTKVSKDRVRMSWPIFCSPPGDLVVGPLPQLISDRDPAKFKAMKFKDYQYCKLNKIPMTTGIGG